jgi:hypothetical protein
MTTYSLSSLGEALFLTLNKLREEHSWDSIAADYHLSPAVLEQRFWAMMHLMNDKWIPNILSGPSREDIMYYFTTEYAKEFVAEETGRRDVLILVSDTTTIKTNVRIYLSLSFVLVIILFYIFFPYFMIFY